MGRHERQMHPYPRSQGHPTASSQFCSTNTVPSQTKSSYSLPQCPTAGQPNSSAAPTAIQTNSGSYDSASQQHPTSASQPAQPALDINVIINEAVKTHLQSAGLLPATPTTITNPLPSEMSSGLPTTTCPPSGSHQFQSSASVDPQHSPLLNSAWINPTTAIKSWTTALVIHSNQCRVRPASTDWLIAALLTPTCLQN